MWRGAAALPPHLITSIRNKRVSLKRIKNRERRKHTMPLKIAAKLSDNTYVLVDEDMDLEDPPADAAGRILLEGRRLGKPQYLGSIANHNPYMEPLDADEVEADLEKLLQDVTVVGPSKDKIGEPREWAYESEG